MTRQHIAGLLTASRAVHAAFGAPGDYGYDTKEGAALYQLYLAMAAAEAAAAEAPNGHPMPEAE